MALYRDKLLLFGAAVGVRFVLMLLFPTLSTLLSHRVEISTPITGFQRLQEGLFLYTHNVSPYDGGVYHQAPLLLPLFSLLPDPTRLPLWTTLVYAFTDVLSANALIQIASSGESKISRLFTSPRQTSTWTPLAIGAAYVGLQLISAASILLIFLHSFLFNPFTLATNIAKPTIVFTHCAILQAIATAVSGRVANSVFALAVASYLSMYPILLAPPLALLAYDQKARSVKEAPSMAKFAVGYILLLGGTITLLLYASYAVVGFSWQFLASTYGAHLLLSDLTPNVGLWWYFFIEMFDSFRGFFLGVFWLHMASYSGGLTIRIRKQPLFAIIALLGIFAILKPYPSISDASFFFALVPLYSHVFPLLRYSFIATAALLYATFLGPAFYHLWIYAGSGNANFFYAITLVWSLGLAIFVSDCMWAVLRDEFEVERPEIAGKDVKQI